MSPSNCVATPGSPKVQQPAIFGWTRGTSRRFDLSAVAAAVIGIFTGFPALAGPDPTAFINNLGSQLQVVAIEPSSVQRQPGFRQLLEEDFDVPGISRFVLGRFWRVFTPSEQQQFVCYFENYVVLTFSDRLAGIAADGAVFKVTGSRPDVDGVIVFSQISRRAGQAIRVDWHLTASAGAYKVSDVVIDSVSMTLSGRSDLEGVVERNGGRPDSILPVMRQETASGSTRGMPDRCRSIVVEHVRAPF
jgi:phospholipid transport system substrate-binding protein